MNDYSIKKSQTFKDICFKNLNSSLKNLKILRPKVTKNLKNSSKDFLSISTHGVKFIDVFRAFFVQHFGTKNFKPAF